MLLRFLFGGAVVSAFASLGDVLEPKTFAGLFGAAPSVAIASLFLAVHQHGTTYGSHEGASMLLGAAAFFLYASVVSRVMLRAKWAALPVTALALLLWLATALGLWFATERLT